MSAYPRNCYVVYCSVLTGYGCTLYSMCELRCVEDWEGSLKLSGNEEGGRETSSLSLVNLKCCG
jgi:hypothetical protein